MQRHFLRYICVLRFTGRQGASKCKVPHTFCVRNADRRLSTSMFYLLSQLGHRKSSTEPNKRFGPKGQCTSLPPSLHTGEGVACQWRGHGGWHIPGGGLTLVLTWLMAGGGGGGGKLNQRSCCSQNHWSSNSEATMSFERCFEIISVLFCVLVITFTESS